MEAIFQTMIRTAIAYMILLIATYFFGKRMASHLNYHSFAVSITIGSIISNIGFDINLKFWPTVVSLFTLIFVSLLTSYLSFKQNSLRKYLAGQPILIIEKGKVNEFNMNKAKYTMDDLQQQLREQGKFHIEEIETALLEVSGKLSIQPKEKYIPVVKQDLDQLSKARAIEFIIDGKIVEENITSVHNRNWVEKQCQIQNVKVEQVSYAVLGSNGFFYVYQTNSTHLIIRKA